MIILPIRGGMMKKVILITALCSFLLCLLGGYYFTLWMGERDNRKEMAQEQKVMQSMPLIHSNTKMIYQYFYSRDKVTKEQIEMAPVFLQGMSMEQLQSVYKSWQILLFSPEKVILRCSIDGMSSETYIIAEYEGFLAIFYEDGQRGIHLKEKTEVPISALCEEDAKQVKDGIKVLGEENLAKFLSDFMS